MCEHTRKTYGPNILSKCVPPAVYQHFQIKIYGVPGVPRTCTSMRKMLSEDMQILAVASRENLVESDENTMHHDASNAEPASETAPPSMTLARKGSTLCICRRKCYACSAFVKTNTHTPLTTTHHQPPGYRRPASRLACIGDMSKHLRARTH